MLRKLFGIKQRVLQHYLSGNDQGKCLMFHQVNDDKVKWHFPGMAITEKNFKILIDKLIVANYNFITPYQIEGKLDKDSVLVTFDDPFEDGIEYGARYLMQKNIPFTVFITRDLIGKEQYITEEQLEMLIKDHLCTIGSHCLTHSILRKMSAQNCFNELTESKKYFANITMKNVDFLAYPYGSIYAVGKKEQDLARDAGYKLAFSALQAGFNQRSLKHKYFLPRYNVNDSNYERYLNDR